MGMDLGEIGREAAVPKRPFEVWERAREGISVAFAATSSAAKQIKEVAQIEQLVVGTSPFSDADRVGGEGASADGVDRGGATAAVPLCRPKPQVE
ncbi:hypothetical protein E2562_027703 [Oryza meyeriana var. granulata]|uniref:Uncharacterized protein n=1 Tax=Oryza meyeriana var. granulata TaxID=110450 RepID=A0A6G1CSF6_9ORYZ|nr:hypothetical protein E2562_027703 [Oryza meyeriana var. granulata]